MIKKITNLKFMLFVAVLIAGAISFSFDESKGDNTGYDIGDTVTDFSLKNIDDEMVSLSDYEEAKGFIVVFTCNHCPYAKAYEQRIMDLDEAYADKGFPVIAINPNDPELEPDDSFENMQKRAEEKGYSFPYLIDANQEVYPRFGATRTPHVFVLSSKDDTYKVEYIGAIDNNTKSAKKASKHYVKDAVDALLKGEKPGNTKTKAIGCSIKAKK